MKKQISGIVHNISTNPFQTFTKKRGRNSALLSFDISFDLVDDDGKITHVWFNRSFRFPPQLEDGDYLQVFGKFGHFFGLTGRHNLYAIRILDMRRNKEYTAWRNKEMDVVPEVSPEKGDDYEAPQTSIQ